MQRFSASARWIVTVIFIPIAITVIGEVIAHFITQQPEETANVVLRFLLDLSKQTWLRYIACFLAGLVAGLWLDWFLRKLDSSRAKEIKELGNLMIDLANSLGRTTNPMDQGRGQLRSCFISARKLGIWAPDDQIFGNHRAFGFVRDYLMNIGNMLYDGHFYEAKQFAERKRDESPSNFPV
jgi:hypothetical protein